MKLHPYLQYSSFTISARIVKSWIRSWPRYRSERKERPNKNRKNLVNSLYLLWANVAKKKAISEDFGSQVVNDWWFFGIGNTWVFNCPLSWFDWNCRNGAFRRLQKNQAFDGLRSVEEILLCTCWMPSRYGMLEAYWKGFAKTLDLRARWQRPEMIVCLKCMLGMSMFLESSSPKSFLSGSVKRICVLNLFLGMIFFRNTEFHDVSWAI